MRAAGKPQLQLSFAGALSRGRNGGFLIGVLAPRFDSALSACCRGARTFGHNYVWRVLFSVLFRGCSVPPSMACHSASLLKGVAVPVRATAWRSWALVAFGCIALPIVPLAARSARGGASQSPSDYICICIRANKGPPASPCLVRAALWFRLLPCFCFGALSRRNEPSGRCVSYLMGVAIGVSARVHGGLGRIARRGV